MNRNISSYQSNNYDALLHLLYNTLKEAPEKRILIIVPNQLVKNTLQKKLLTLSEGGGVTLYSFLELSPALIKLFKWNTRKNIALPNRNLLSLEIERLLSNTPPSGFDEIEQYVSMSPKTRIPPLAQQLADAYLTLGKYLHDNVSLLFDNDVQTDWDTPIDIIQNHLTPSTIEADIFLFGFQHIPHIYYSLFEHIAKYSAVHIFSLFPTNEYVGDITKYSDTSAHLFAQFGTQKRKEMNLLLDKEYEKVPVFVEPRTKGQLGNAQKNLMYCLENSTTTTDPSFRLISAPSDDALVSYVHEEIAQSIMEGNKASDHLVLVSDTKEYYPVIEHVFQEPNQAIPTTLYEQQKSSGFTAQFVQVLQLLRSRCSKDELLEKLELPLTRDGMDLSLADIHLIKQWLEKTHFRWGLNKEHKEEEIGRSDEIGTLHMSLKLLAKGLVYLQDEEAQHVDKYSPVSLDVTHIDTVERLNTLYEVLDTFRAELRRELSAKDWSARYACFIESVFPKATSKGDLLRICKDALEPLKKGGLYEGYAVLRYLENTLGLSKHVHGGGLLDAVTVAPFLAEYMYGVKYIYVLGVDESHPGKDTRNIFYTRETLREYVPTKKDMFANAVLSSILLAEKQLTFLYSKRDRQDGRVQAPHEYIEYIDSFFPLQKEHVDGVTFLDTKKRAFPASLNIKKAFFTQKNHIATHDSLLEPLEDAPKLLESITVDTLQKAYSHPLRLYCQKTLQLYLKQNENESDEREFLLHPLDRYKIKENGKGLSGKELLEKIKAVGGLPHGSFSELAEDTIRSHFDEKKKLLDACGIPSLQTIRLDQGCNEFHEVKPTYCIAPAPKVFDVCIQGDIQNTYEDTLCLFEKPTLQGIIKNLGTIIAFSAYKPNGFILFALGNTKYPSLSLTPELLIHAQRALDRPFPLLPELIPSLLAEDSFALHKKIGQLVSGYPFPNPYASLFLSEDIDTEGLISTWGAYTEELFSFIQTWGACERV